MAKHMQEISFYSHVNYSVTKITIKIISKAKPFYDGVNFFL